MRNAEAWKTGWRRLATWPGWTAWLRWPVWKKIGCWPGWKRLFRIPIPAALALAAVSGAGLVWIFLTGREASPAAYPIYCLAFYALVTVCVGLPAAVRGIRAALEKNPLTARYLSDQELRFRLSLYGEQLVNFVYGLFKIVSGVVLGSAWVGADGIYNFTQGVIQLVQILRRRRHLSLQDQWKSYRLCGWLTLAMHLTMTGPVFQMTRMDRYEEYPGWLILATAAFTFYKLIDAAVDVARDRRHKAPVDSAVRLLNLSQAMFSLFSLQVAMIHQFGGTAEFARLANTLTGGAVCLMVVLMGIYMLRRSRRAIKHLEEEANG